MKGESAALPLASLAGGVLLAFVLGFSLGAPRRLVSLVISRHAPHRLDGRIEPGEYRFRWQDEASKLRFEWSVEGDRLLGAVFSPDTGWVAVGFGGDGPLMYGADIVIGYVDARGAHLRDHYASTPTNHDPDSALGGSDDVLAAAGLETAEGTMVEFVRPLAAHDSTDQPIESGQTHLMAASSETDDFAAYHFGGRKAVSLVDLFAGPPAVAERDVLPDHITDVQIMLATWMALLLIVGAHGLASQWAARLAEVPGEGPASGADAAVALIAVFVLAEIAALGVFGLGVVVAAPAWLVGSALALGLLALAGIILLYGRAFVSWEIVRGEREDGIPW